MAQHLQSVWPNGQRSRKCGLNAWACATFALFIGTAAVAMWLAAAELAFRRDTLASVSSASRTRNTQCYARLAELDEHNAAMHMRAAVKANPRDAALWIGLGLALERESPDAVSQASQSLEQAAKVNKQYLPAWTLANFAFRHGDTATFWRAARHAAALAYDNRRPLIELASRVEPVPETALDRMQASAPVERDYLDFLIIEGHLGDAIKVARRILRRRETASEGASPESEDGKRLAAFTGRLLDAHHTREALEIWNRLGWFPATSAHAALTNGDLERMPSGVGFDWRIGSLRGVQSAWRPHVIQFDFSGSQPEVFSLFEQWVVAHGQSYRLTFDYKLLMAIQQFPASSSGLRWSWESPALGATKTSAPLEPANDWRTLQWEFRAQSGRVDRLRLIHRRDPGETRVACRLLLRRLRMENIRHAGPSPEVL